MSDSDPSARELREKYQILFVENSRLREEIGLLKARLRDGFLPAPLPGMQNTRISETPVGGQTRESLFSSRVRGEDP